jgi:hypothetical protein
MLKNILLFAVFAGLLSTHFSCKVTNDEDASVNIDPVFDLMMIEDLQNNRELSFWVRSIELQNCENSTIGHNLETTTTNINITLNDIISPPDCIMGNQVAETEIKLGFLPLARVFNTEFDIKNTVKNNGQLTINPDAYLLELESMDGFGSVTEKLYKISDNLIWGYIAYNDDEVVGDIPTNFQTDLDNHTNVKSLQTGYYGHFSIAENERLNLPQPLGFEKVITFYYNYFGDDQVLIDLIENYRSANNEEDISFKIFTAEGNVF